MSGYVISGAQKSDGTRGDLFVCGSQFVDDAPAGAQRIDAEGLVALPGFVDLHTHLREPGDEEAETVATGSAAAARGGYTAVFAMANTSPVTDTVARVAAVRELARQASAQVLPVAAITEGLGGQQLTDFASLAAAGVRVFSDDGRCVMNAQLMRLALEQAARSDALIAQHSQDHHLANAQACADEAPIAAELGLPGWPWVAEAAIVARDAQLTELTGARLHVCHVSTAETVDVVRWAKSRGVKISAEATPHHLLLTSAQLRGFDTTFKVNPPLRSDEDVAALREAVADGTVDVIGTDHAPHTPSDKAKPFPDAKPGMIGLEQALAVVIETLVNPGRLGWLQVADAMSRRPAALGRLAGQGRPLAPGEPANLVLIDPARRGIVNREASASKGRNNPYHGLDLPDPVELTMWAGRITYARSLSR